MLDMRHERPLILLLSPIDPDKLNQSKFTDYEIDIIKNIALEELHGQRKFKKKQVAFAF